MPSGGKLKVYDDGRCAFCQWMQSLIERDDRDRRLEFRDYNLPDHAAETPFTLAELSYRMRLQTPDGRWLSGFDAWRAVLKVLPRWRWLGRLAGGPPLRWIGPAVYQFIADRRYRVPPWFLRLVGAPRSCDEACVLPSVGKTE